MRPNWSFRIIKFRIFDIGNLLEVEWHQSQLLSTSDLLFDLCLLGLAQAYDWKKTSRMTHCNNNTQKWSHRLYGDRIFVQCKDFGIVIGDECFYSRPRYCVYTKCIQFSPFWRDWLCQSADPDLRMDELTFQGWQLQRRSFSRRKIVIELQWKKTFNSIW